MRKIALYRVLLITVLNGLKVTTSLFCDQELHSRKFHYFQSGISAYWSNM